MMIKRKLIVIILYPILLIVDILIGLSGYRSFRFERLYTTWYLGRMWRNDHSDDTESINEFMRKKGYIEIDKP